MGKKKSRPSRKPKPRQKKAQLPKKMSKSELCEKLLRLCSVPVEPARLWDNYLEITAVLDEINLLSEAKSSETKRLDAVDNFLKWLKDNDVHTEHVAVSEFPSYGMGLKMRSCCNAGDAVLEIPSKLFFSVETAALELSVLRNEPLIQHMPQVGLTLALLVEKHKGDSKWKPYLDILPDRYSTVLYTRPSDLLELKGSPTLDLAIKLIRNIFRQFAYFSEMFDNTRNPVSDLLRPRFTWEEYRWAVSTVMSRQNRIPRTVEGTYALIPMWDMCNHEEGEITTDFNDDKDMLVCYAKRGFISDEQFFICYGQRTNPEFFLHSGFVYPHNKNGGFSLHLPISEEDSLYKDRMSLLEKLGLIVFKETFLLIDGPEPITGDLLAFLRVFNMRKTELDHWLKTGKVHNLRDRDCALDTVAEENVRKFLSTRLQLLLDGYPTTLAEDEELIKTTTQHEKRMMIQLRIMEKRILVNTLDYVAQWKV